MEVKRGALLAAILGSAVVGVDATAVNVALPTIADDLGGGLAGQQWVANAYLLTLASLILVSGSLADLYGERRIFTLGVGGFGAASLLCAVAPTIELLVLARGLQGVFGALLTPASLAIIVTVFPERERGAAIGTLDGVGRHRLPRRAAARRPARRPGVVALGLLPQPPARAAHARAGAAVRPGRARRGRAAPPAGPRRRAALRGRARRALVRPDRAAAARLVRPRRRAPARRRRARPRRLPGVRAPARRSPCCRSSCSGGATSASPTWRRSSCTAGWRCRGSSSSSSCSRSRGSARPRRARRTSCRRR